MSEQGSPQEALAALRAHVQSARQAAERLAHDAGSRTSTQSDEEGEPTPRQGWAQREAPVDGGSGELQALAELIGSLRSLLPDELREAANELLRQLLALLRAVIDWLAVRMQPPEHGAQPQVEDIPIM